MTRSGARAVSAAAAEGIDAARGRPVFAVTLNATLSEPECRCDARARRVRIAGRGVRRVGFSRLVPAGTGQGAASTRCFPARTGSDLQAAVCRAAAGKHRDRDRRPVAAQMKKPARSDRRRHGNERLRGRAFGPHDPAERRCRSLQTPALVLGNVQTRFAARNLGSFAGARGASGPEPIHGQVRGLHRDGPFAGAAGRSHMPGLCAAGRHFLADDPQCFIYSKKNKLRKSIGRRSGR